MQLQVVIQPKQGGARNEVLAVFPVHVGRGAQSTLRLESDMVSRQHIVVHLGQSGIIVEDVSTNGTLAGARLLRKESAEVGFGTPIVVGDFTLTFYPVVQPQAGARMTRPAPRISGAAPPAPLPNWDAGPIPRSTKAQRRIRRASTNEICSRKLRKRRSPPPSFI